MDKQEEIQTSQQGQLSADTVKAPCGCSNTPPRWSEPLEKGEGGFPRFNCCIDYLKVTFPGDFFPEMGRIKPFLPLLSAYKVRIQDAVRRGGLNGYKRGYEFDEHLIICAGGEYTKKVATDEETFNIEMKGEGCRDFEKKVRYENQGKTDKEVDAAVLAAWKHLFETILEFRGNCTRIDLPTDDFCGFVPLEELKPRIKNRIYASRMRRNDKIDPNSDGDNATEDEKEKYFDEEEEWDENPMDGTIRTSNNGGYTATLGTRTYCQLCIYNKKAEREHNTMGVVNMPNWVRFECRFYHRTADHIFTKMVAEVDEKDPCSFNKFCVGCLAGIIEFKDKKKKQIRHAEVWPIWKQFIGEVSKVETVSQSRVESTVQSNALWLNADASKAIARICMCYPKLSNDLFYALLRDGIGRFDQKDLAKINNQRRQDQLPLFENLEDLSKKFLEDYGKIPEPDEKMVKFLAKEVAKLNGVKVMVNIEPIVESSKKETEDKPKKGDE